MVVVGCSQSSDVWLLLVAVSRVMCGCCWLQSVE